MQSKIPIRSFEEYRAKKIRFPGGMIAEIFRAAGVSTVLLPGGEVYLALEKGVIDGSDFVGAAIRDFSFKQYTGIQKADNEAYEKFKQKGVEIIRLKDSDIDKFRKFAPELWVKWAKKHPLAMKAFKSQWEFMKSIKVGYYTDADLIDTQGKRLSL